MATVKAEALVAATLAEVWDVYFEPRGWSGWVDEFRGINEIEDGYPEVGGRLVWHSGPAGRGTVTERVLDHEPRRLHRISYSDENSEGQQTTRFEIAGEGVKVSLELSYDLVNATFIPGTDRFFVRPQMRGSLERSLVGLGAEVGELAAASEMTADSGQDARDEG